MIKLDSNNISAIIGVSGTLLGVILGAIFNRLTRIGRIRIYQNSIEKSIMEQSSMGDFIVTDEVTEKTHFVSIKLNIDFYNTSPNSVKIARRIVFLVKHGKDSFKYELNDDDTRHSTGVMIVAQKLKNINLSPNQVINYSLSCSTNKNFKETLNGDWFIEYRNNNDKIRRIKLNKNRL